MTNSNSNRCLCLRRFLEPSYGHFSREERREQKLQDDHHDIHETPSPTPSPLSLPLLSLLTFFLLTSLLSSSGVIYGYNSLQQWLLEENQYATLCSPSSLSTHNSSSSSFLCDSQENRLILISTIGNNIANIGSVLSGLMMDYLSIRYNGIIGHALSATGYLLLALGSESGSGSSNSALSIIGDPFIWGFSLISLGGIILYLCLFQFCNLYYRSTLIQSILNGLYGLSGLNFTILYYIETTRKSNGGESGYNRKNIFLFYSIMVFILGAMCIVFYPHRSSKWGDKYDIPMSIWWRNRRGKGANITMIEAEINEKNNENNNNGNDKESKKDYGNEKNNIFTIGSPQSDGYNYQSPSIEQGEDEEKSINTNDRGQHHSIESTSLISSHIAQSDSRVESDDPSSSLPSPSPSPPPSLPIRFHLFALHTLWQAVFFGIILLVSNFYNSSLKIYLDQMFHNNNNSNSNSTNDTNSDINNLITIFIVLLSILPTLLSPLIEKFILTYKYSGTIYCISALSVASFAILYIPVPSGDTSVIYFVFIVSFLMLSFYRSLLFVLLFAYLSTEYPSVIYGRLLGWITLICSLIGLFQLLMQYMIVYTFDSNYDVMNGICIGMCVPFFWYGKWMRNREKEKEKGREKQKEERK